MISFWLSWPDIGREFSATTAYARAVPACEIKRHMQACGSASSDATAITEWTTIGMQKSDELLRYLEDKGIHAKTFEHPALHTVEESRALRGDIPGIHTKNLFLRDSKRNYFLVVTDESTSIQLKALARKIGAKGNLSFGSPDALMEL
ncbi:YbaK/EbsC family protein, partial [Bradyrhizobium sp.]|uniref:YbaK/EbsC family protein n=1 Tax=Bradyrhizobium sp. TaxID=376 RepID=UPI003C6EE743